MHKTLIVSALFLSACGDLVSNPCQDYVDYVCDCHDGEAGYDCDTLRASHDTDDVELYEDTTFPQRNQLFLNIGDGRYEEHVAVAGALALKRVSRGAAFGDYDDDGDIDVLVANLTSRPTLMRNDGDAGHWLRLRLEGVESNRAGIGARVAVHSGGLVQTDEVRSGASFLSQSDLQLHFGLGAAEVVERVVVHWPSGLVEEYAELVVDRELVLVEGAGR